MLTSRYYQSTRSGQGFRRPETDIILTIYDNLTIQSPFVEEVAVSFFY